MQTLLGLSRVQPLLKVVMFGMATVAMTTPVCAQDKTSVDAAAPIKLMVFGDMPYTQGEAKALAAPAGQLYQLVQAEQPAVLIHLGDTKNGGLPCTDELLKTNTGLIAGMYPGKVLLTPGDNDWTDCDRPALVPNFDELERWQFFKNWVYGEKQSHFTGKLTGLSQQTVQPENQLLTLGQVRIATLHVPGTDNGQQQILKSDVVQAKQMAKTRMANNMAWLAQLFSVDAKAYVIAMQADMYESFSATCQELQPCSDNAYRELRVALVDYAKRLNKPILLMHGDTGDYCFEQREPMLWRLNAPGDFRYYDIAQVLIDVNQAQPFSVKSSLVADLPNTVCSE